MVLRNARLRNAFGGRQCFPRPDGRTCARISSIFHGRPYPRRFLVPHWTKLVVAIHHQSGGLGGGQTFGWGVTQPNRCGPHRGLARGETRRHELFSRSESQLNGDRERCERSAELSCSPNSWPADIHATRFEDISSTAQGAAERSGHTCWLGRGFPKRMDRANNKKTRTRWRCYTMDPRNIILLKRRGTCSLRERKGVVTPGRLNAHYAKEKAHRLIGGQNEVVGSRKAQMTVDDSR